MARNPETGLNERQQLFADYYAETFDATKSAIRAGYSTHTAGNIGWTLAHHPRVAAVIKERIEKASATSLVDQEYVLQSLRRNAERCMSVHDGSAANRALELLGKHLGMFVERSENKNVNFNVDGGVVRYKVVLAEEA